MPLNLSFDSLNTAILIVDRQYQIIDLNASAKELLGFSTQQNQPQDLFEFIQVNFAKDFLQQVEQQQTKFIEEAHLRVGSKLVTANIMLSAFEQAGKEYLLLELQASNHPWQIKNDMHLQQQSRVSDHLIKNLAHEIKNPLGGIKGAAQLLERKLPKDFSTHYSQIILQEAERLDSLVNRLLLPAEPEEKTYANIHKIIDKAFDIILLQQASSISIEKDYDPSLPNLLVSISQIQQSLINLIKNAFEAVNQKGKVVLRTRIEHQKTIGKIQFKQVIRIDVIDNGCGIPENLIKDIFFPTISGKNSSGLGLSIAQSLIQRHSGLIELESNKANNNEGETCFSIYLPVINSDGDNE